MQQATGGPGAFSGIRQSLIDSHGPAGPLLLPGGHTRADTRILPIASVPQELPYSAHLTIRRPHVQLEDEICTREYQQKPAGKNSAEGKSSIPRQSPVFN